MFSVFSYRVTEKHLLIGVLILAAILRFWSLSSAEFYHDEGFTAFRSIGYLDYMNNDDQTTPIQWFKDLPSLPWWTSLSFHDHPPLFFLTQFFSFKLFGNTLFAARFPSALAGVLSVYIIYLISKRIFKNKSVVFIPPLLLSINLINIWVSRSSLFESVEIFFILLNIYYFFQFLEDRRRWKLFGLTLGLSFLAKYTSFFLIPVYAVYLAYLSYQSYKSHKIHGTNKSDWFHLSDWHLYAALGLALLLFTPVIIYNIFLYRTVGHFDLQFAFLFHQPTPEWQASLGKIQDPFSEIISNLSLMYSIPFLLLAIMGIGYAIYWIFKSKIKYWPKTTDAQKYNMDDSAIVFWFLNIIFITLMLTAVGSAFRFISLYAVPAIMLIAFFIDELISRFNGEILLRILIAGFFVYELSFGFSILWTFPDFGIVTLDKYFDAEFTGRRSLTVPSSSNIHLDEIIKENAARFPVMEKPVLIIHDTNIALSPRLWLFTRRNYYQGIPVLSVDQFKNFLKIGGTDQFNNYLIYFVKAGKNTQLNPAFYTPSGEEFEYFLRSQFNLGPVKLIYGYNNLPMFTVYKFNL